jgi:hypothetical protein
MTVEQGTHAFQNFGTARRLLLSAVLAVAAATGCAAETGMLDDDPDADPVEVAGSEEALQRGGGGPRLGFSCTGGTCTCDKSIENDCEDMSGVCTDGTVDDLIACIDGWLTTHCVCTQIRTSSGGKGSVYQPPTGGVLKNTAVFSIAK